MTAPLISILVPCHNAESWLGTALSSAKGQTWPRVEIIVVDDGSTDGSYEIARRMASVRCRVVRQEKRGNSVARNHALHLAQGEFIQYLDTGDILAVDKIEKQMRAAAFTKSDALSFGSAGYFFDSIETGERHMEPARLNSGCDDPIEFLIDLLGGNGQGGLIEASQWLAPRRLVEEAGPWNDQLSIDNDGEFFTRLILAASEVIAVPGAWSYYRRCRQAAQALPALTQSFFGQRSALLAAQLKSVYILGSSLDTRARQVVSRLLTEEIVRAYPAFPALASEGLAFLRERSLELAPLTGDPWFQHLYPWLGWKKARWLQWNYSRWKRSSGSTVGSSLSSRLPAAADRLALSPGAGRYNQPRATSRLPA